MPRPQAALRREGEKALREFVVLARQLISLAEGYFEYFVPVRNIPQCE